MGTTRCSNDAIAQFLQDSRVLILRPYSTSEISNDLIVGGTVSYLGISSELESV